MRSEELFVLFICEIMASSYTEQVALAVVSDEMQHGIIYHHQPHPHARPPATFLSLSMGSVAIRGP